MENFARKRDERQALGARVSGDLPDASGRRRDPGAVARCGGGARRSRRIVARAFLPVLVFWSCGAGILPCRRLSSRRARGQEIVVPREQAKITVAQAFLPGLVCG